MSTESITGAVIAGRYQITGYLRPGRMGDHYVARRIADNTLVGVKLLDPSLFSESEAVQRFQNECLVTSRIQHPCSLTVLDYGQSERGPFMVTEHVVGESLAEAIEDSGPMPADRAARIAGQIALALDAAHHLGVVHRDLSPPNVLLAERGDQRDVVKVLEFGLSRMTVDDTSTDGLTAVGVRIGTPTYMAPEYIEQYTLDARADLYALGVVLYEMLTGKPPFVGRPYKVMDHHLTKPMPVPSEHVAGVPPWVDALVEALTRKSPGDRLQTAREVVDRIEAGLGGRIVAVAETSTPAGPPAPEPEPPAVPEVDPVLAHFIRECLDNIRRGPGGRIDPRECLVVERVAQPSLAWELGIRAGHLLRLPDDHHHTYPQNVLTTPIVDDRRYQFAARDGSESFEIRANGMALGIDVVRSAEHIRATWDPTGPDVTPLFDLWKLRDWDLLERMSLRALTQQRGAAAALSSGLFAKFLGRGEFQVRDHPALLLHGAAQIERGESAGMELVKEYLGSHAHRWPPCYDAIGRFYLAMAQARRGADQEALDLLHQSVATWPLERSVQAMAKMTGRTSPAGRLRGKPFPDYGLDTLDQKTNHRLSATRSAMDASQVVLVCVLGAVRGGALYNEFMERYLSFAAWFPDFVADLHVLTTMRIRDAEHPEHYKAEDLVVQAHMPLKVLEDYRAFVFRETHPPRVPTIYVVGKHGIVVHEGMLTPADWWESLAENGRVRLETHSRTRQA